MDVALPILLMVFGLGLIILDVFVPTMGLMTVIAIASFAGSLVLGFGISATLGWILVGAGALGLPILLTIAFKLFPHTRLGRKMMLLGREDTTHLHPESFRDDLLGKEGTTISSLRPSGAAEVAGERMNVVTRGEMVDAGQRIVVIDNKGNRLLVRAVAKAHSDRSDAEEDLP